MQKSKKLPIILLGIILCIAGFLRFYQLDTNPPSLNWDEAAWGYNAYSLGIDGKDEFGRFLPYEYLESFGDFKPPLYAYLTILPVKIFDLTPFATRFPSAFFGTLSVLVTYFLVKKIFMDKFDEKESVLFSMRENELIAIISSAILAISPWHILLSRAAFEANVSTFLIMSGVYFLYSGKSGKSFGYIFSAVLFSLAFYTFNSARIVVPFLVLLFTALYWRTLLLQKKQVFLATICALILLLPLTNFLLSPQASLRFKEVSIFTDTTLVTDVNQAIAHDGNALWSKVIHNRRFAYSVSYAKHFLDNINMQFLFFQGDKNPRFSVQDVGQMYLWELPFLIIGIFLLIRHRKHAAVFILLWLLIGIIPAGVARETPHALRIEGSLPTFQILSAVGVTFFLLFAKRKLHARYFRIVVLVFCLVGTLHTIHFLHSYFAHYKTRFSSEWQYGTQESVTFTESQKHLYDKIYITNALGRPYIFTLFYAKVDPRIFRQEQAVRRDAFGFVTVDGFGKYKFGEDLEKLETKEQEEILYINTPERVPNGSHIVKRFYQLNGKEVLTAYEK